MQPALTQAELAIMELLWQHTQLTARAIREQLYAESTRSQHGTVQKLLQRLEDKGYVSRDRDLHVHLFAACVSREGYACGQLESLAETVTGGSIAPLLTHLVEREKLSRSELLRLRELLDAHAPDEDAR